MNDIPLIQKADINSINTSIIAIKKQLKQLNEALGLVDVPSIDTSVFVKKSDVVDVVQSGNMNPVTSNAVAEVADSLEPVDEVTSGNMQSVTSNAVAECGIYSTEEVYTGKTWYDGKKIYRKCYYNLSVSIANPNTWYTVMAYPTFIDTITDYITIANKIAFQNSLIYKLSNNLAILSSQSWVLNALVLEYTKV
jgi:hypothetical protein